MNRRLFLETLFDPDDLVAWGDKDAYCSRPKSPWPDMIFTKDVKFCINPLKEKRNEENVTQINCMLFEMDKDPNDNIIPKDTQVSLFQSSGLPYSTMTWSGTKSVHVIVRLTTPIPKPLFKPLWQACYNVLTRNGCSLDTRTNLVPQLSRIPGSIRHESGDEQELLEVRSRVTLQELGQWLKANGETVSKPKPPKPFEPIRTDKSNLDKFKIARRWSERKSIYTPSWTTGGHVWFFNLGVNLRKLDCDLQQGVSFAKVEWGETCETGTGREDIMIPISKGWYWVDKK